MTAPIKMFMTRSFSFGRQVITPVECERVTASSVFIGGRREAKSTHYTAYHDSWQKARDHLISLRSAEVARLEASLVEAKRVLAQAEAIPEAQP